VTKVTWDNICTSKPTTFTIQGTNLSAAIVAKVQGCTYMTSMPIYSHTGGDSVTRTFKCDPFGGTAGFLEGVSVYWQVGTTYTALYSTNMNCAFC
jgi:hypothetical protein